MFDRNFHQIKIMYPALSQVQGEAKSFHWMQADSQIASSAMLLSNCRWIFMGFWLTKSFPLLNLRGESSPILHVSAWKKC